MSEQEPRYWEGRWRDEYALNQRLEAALRHAAGHLSDLEYHYHGDKEAMWRPIRAALAETLQEQVGTLQEQVRGQDTALQGDHIIRVVLQAHGFPEDKLDDLTWLRPTHAYAVARRVAAALADGQGK